MMKKLLFSLLALVASTGAFAHEDGDYVYTGSQRFKVTGANLLTNGDFTDGTNGWTDNQSNAVSAESWSVQQGMGPEGGIALTSLGATENLGICQSVSITPGKMYAVSFFIKGTEVANTSVTTAFINMDGSLTKAENTTDAPVVTILSSASYKDQWSEVVAVVAADDTLSTKEGTPMLVINIGGLPTDVSVANFSVNEVVEVYDIRVVERQIAFAQQLMEEPAFNTSDAASAKEELAGTIESIQGMMAAGDLDDESTAEGIVEQLSANIEEYLGVTSVNVNSSEGNLIPGLNIADLANWGRAGQYSASYLLNLSGNWGHLDSEQDVLRSAIQTGYDHTASYQAYNNDFPAGKYFFTAEVRNANTGKTSWPTEPVFNLEKKVQFYIGETTFPLVTISGEGFQRFYFIADIPEGGFKAGVKWPFDVETEELKSISGGAFFIRGTQVRSFNKDIRDQVSHIQAFQTYMTQWNAATGARHKLIEMQNDTNYPWGQETLTEARAKWDPYYKAQGAKEWALADGSDAGIASTEELLDWASYQGVEEYNTDPETGEPTTRKTYQVVRGYQGANNAVIALNKPFTDLAEAIDAAKKDRNQGANLTGDRDAYKTAIEKAIETITTVRAATTDATRVADSTTLANALEELKAAGVTFLASVTDRPVVDIDFANEFVAEEYSIGSTNYTYSVTGEAGKMWFQTVEPDNATGSNFFQKGYNGELNDVLRVGNTAAVVELPEAPTDNDAVRVQFDLWFGSLSGKFCYVELRNADNQCVAGFSLNRYNGTLDYNEFEEFHYGGDEGKTFIHDKGMNIRQYASGLGSKSVGNAGICVDANKSSFELVIDYKNGTVQGTINNGKNGKQEGEALPIPTKVHPNKSDAADITDNKVVRFAVGSNYGTDGRRCWFDNLKISKYQLTDLAEDITADGWGKLADNIDYDENFSDGIQNVVSERFAGAIYTINGVQVKSASKPGLYIQNGKKFVVK